MKKVKNTNWFIVNKEKWLLIFLFIQPFLDLLTSICINTLKIDITVGIIIRIMFLMFLFFYFTFWHHSETKRKTSIYLGIIGVYVITFLSQVIILKGNDVLFYELQNIIRNFYYPCSFILLLDIFKDESLQIENKNWKKIFMIYILLIFIPTITNTGLNGYTQGKVGNIGWFNSSNEISAIISLLLPLFIVEELNNKNKLLMIIEILINLYVIFNLGSKIVILSLLIIAMYYGIKYLKKLLVKKEVKKISLLAGIFIVGLISSLLIIPKTNFYKNIKIHLDYLEIDNPIEVLTDIRVFDHFVFSSRLSFLENTNNSYQNSEVTEKLLGIGYIENYGTDQVSLKTIEMDPFDIFFRHGIIGFLIYFLPLIVSTIKIIKTRKKVSTKYKLCFGLSFLLMTLSGHVITAPSVSIYLSVITTLMLTNQKGMENNENRVADY